ncbi:hypothetical protein ABZ869_03705 [Streptomyces sp. NPDC046928]|uniref:SDH family Clp fold serine proteinase n=1 Tax=Streptomyces sp. NPDC046928 TaxID=3155021 RepID=UPI0033D36E4A
MPSWNNLLKEAPANLDEKSAWIIARQTAALGEIGRLRGDRNVVLYGSAFLQKPRAAPESLMIHHEDLNSFMSVIYGMDWSKGLTLVLHTPGGATNATESIVAYLRSKFSDFEVIVPTYAMSAGTMISLAANRVIMGRQSQLGPIDPQLGVQQGRSVSARAIVEQFERARTEVLDDVRSAHVWAPVVQSLGPALLQEAQNALDYSENMVAKWLSAYMFDGEADAINHGKAVAHHFNDASTHKSHGRRIDRDEARQHGVVVEDLEDSQELQEAVLTSYHVMTIGFEHGPAVKWMIGQNGAMWVKNQPPQ